MVSWNWELGDFLGFCDGNSGYRVNNTFNNRDIELDEKKSR